MTLPLSLSRPAQVSRPAARWRFASLLLLLWVLQPWSGTAAAVIHVDQRRADAADSDGRTWPTAFGGLQEAIDAAMPGDELWVAAGIFSKTYP